MPLSDERLAVVPYGGRGPKLPLRGTQRYREIATLPALWTWLSANGRVCAELVYPHQRGPLGTLHPALAGLPELPLGAHIGPADLRGKGRPFGGCECVGARECRAG